MLILLLHVSQTLDLPRQNMRRVLIRFVPQHRLRHLLRNSCWVVIVIGKCMQTVSLLHGENDLTVEGFALARFSVQLNHAARLADRIQRWLAVAMTWVCCPVLWNWLGGLLPKFSNGLHRLKHVETSGLALTY